MFYITNKMTDIQKLPEDLKIELMEVTKPINDLLFANSSDWKGINLDSECINFSDCVICKSGQTWNYFWYKLNCSKIFTKAALKDIGHIQ